VSLPTNFLPSNDLSYIEEKGSKIATPESHKAWSSSKGNDSSSSTPIDKSKIWVPSNPRGAEMLPPGMVAAESDFYLRRLWGLPHEDLKSEPRYLATFTVGINQKANIDACVKKVGSFPLFDVLTSRHKLFIIFSTVFRKLHYCPVSL
jgi:hypothetical protein